MDKLMALRFYLAAFRAGCAAGNAPAFVSDSRYAREWMETMDDFRAATKEELEQHATVAAQWACTNRTPGEAAPLIADGISPERAREMEQISIEVAGGPEEHAAQVIDRLVADGALVDPARVIRIQDPTDPDVEIVDIRDEQ